MATARAILKSANKKENFFSAQDYLIKHEISASSTIKARSINSSSKLYTGSGKNNSGKKQVKSRKFIGTKTGKGALIVFVIFLLSGGAILIGSNSLLGPHISELFTEATDVQHTSYTLRNSRLMRYMLDGGEQIKTTWTGAKKYTTFTPYMKGRLEKNGIKVGSLNDAGEFVEGDFLAGKSRVLQFDGETISANDFTAKYASDAKFREAYYKAKRGRIAGFFDDAADSVYKKLGLSRDVFDDYKQTGDAEADEKSFRETMEAEFSDEADARINTAEDRTTTNDDGSAKTERVDTGDDVNTTNIEGDTPEVKATSYISRVSQKVNAGAGTGCALLKVGNLISIAVAANEIYQSINYFMKNTESISKAKSGEGSSSAINSVLNFFTEPKPSTVIDPETNEEVTTNKAPIEASGARLVFGDTTITAKDTKSYSLNRIVDSTKTAIFTSGLTIAGCSVARSAGAILSLAATALPGGGVVKIITGLLIDTAISVGIQLTITAALSVAIPTIASALFTNVFDNATGLKAGELFASGASAANSRVARTGSGFGVSSAESAVAYNHATQEVLAMEAEVDRLNRSPIDPSSTNTFLGSIINKITPVIRSSGTSSLNSLANLTKTSLASIVPSVTAEGKGASYMTTFGNCEDLQNIGGVCDIYGNAIVSGDLSTIDISPDDPEYQAVIDANVSYDEEGNETIIDNSELAQYITYYVERDSPCGVYDANIANAYNSSLGIVGDNIPILNNVVDLVNAAQDAAVVPIATCEKYVNSKDNEWWNSTGKYFQRYIEDNRILTQMGAFEDSEDPVTAFKNDYYENHPLDNSKIGYLSRITGMTREDAELALDAIDYLSYVYNYDASNKYNFKQEKPEQETNIAFNKEGRPQSFTVVPNQIIFSDIRNRSYAV